MKHIISREKLSNVEKWQLPDMNGVCQTFIQEELKMDPINLSQRLDDAYKIGYLEGKLDQVTEIREDLQHDFCTQLTEEKNKVEQVIQNLMTPWTMINKQVENQVINFIHTSLKKLIRLELSLNPEIITTLVHEALLVLPEVCQSIKLYISEVDYDGVKKYVEENNVDNKAIGLYKDTTLQQGECRVDSEDSHIEILWEKRLAIILDETLKHAE